MLYLIGLGLTCKDISLNALESIKKCRKVYLETYTNIGCTIKELERLFNKKITIANRNLIENNSKLLLNEAKISNIAILVYGDPLSATTHINYLIDCKRLKIKFKIIHATSILTAVGETGLSLYNFGKITSIPFNNENITAPIDVITNNQKLGLHTLILLDLDIENKKFLSINEAINYLLKNNINCKCVVCCALSTKNQEIKYGSMEELKKLKFNKLPQCLIIQGKLHFIEEEALKLL